MKKIYLIILCFMFDFLMALSYSFDFVTKYKVTNLQTKNSSDVVTYFNSDNFNYFMKVYRSKELYSDLFDIPGKRVHRFRIIETKNGGEVIFNFEYLSSRSIYLRTKSKRRVELRPTSGDLQTLEIFSNNRSKKPDYTYQLKLKPANKNLFPMARIAFMHPLEADSIVDIPGNFIVEEASEKLDKTTCFYQLEEYKNVEATITLPEKLEYH